MEINDERIEYAVRQTQILRLPKQTLSTFGTTNVYYYLLTEPSYVEPDKNVDETVIREGRVFAERPKIVTPYYLSRLEGFSPEARSYFNILLNAFGPSAPGLLYTYKNEPKELNIVATNWQTVAENLKAEIEKRGDPLVSIIKGEDSLWDVSLLKFIYELTRGSVADHVMQMGGRGLLNVDSSGVPAGARARIEELFEKARRGECEPYELKSELDRWGLFPEYEDRFLALFRKK